MNDFTLGSGNIFSDIGFSDDESRILLLKSQLIQHLEMKIKNKGMKQSEAAKFLETDQPTLSKVLRGRMESISIERLTSWLYKFGCKVEISIKEI